MQPDQKKQKKKKSWRVFKRTLMCDIDPVGLYN